MISKNTVVKIAAVVSVVIVVIAWQTTTAVTRLQLFPRDVVAAAKNTAFVPPPERGMFPVAHDPAETRVPYGDPSFVVFYMQGRNNTEMEATRACLSKYGVVRRLTYDDPEGDIYYPDSTWAETRNLAIAHGQRVYPNGRRWQWQCHVDGDVEIPYCEQVEKFLRFLDRNRHLDFASPQPNFFRQECRNVRQRKKPYGLAPDERFEAVPLIFQDDEPFLCATPPALPVLHVDPFGMDKNWWIESPQLRFRLAISGLTVTRAAIYCAFMFDNGGHGDYPKERGAHTDEDAFRAFNDGFYGGRLADTCLNFFRGIHTPMKYEAYPCCTYKDTGEVLLCSNGTVDAYREALRKYVLPPDAPVEENPPMKPPS